MKLPITPQGKSTYSASNQLTSV